MSDKDQLEYLLTPIGCWLWYGDTRQFIYWAEITLPEKHKFLKWLGEDDTEETEEEDGSN